MALRTGLPWMLLGLGIRNSLQHLIPTTNPNITLDTSLTGLSQKA